jgi:flagellar hook-associated protein FlgK
VGWGAYDRYQDINLSQGWIAGNSKGDRGSEYNKFMVALQVLDRPVIVVDTLAPVVSTVTEATAAAITKDPISFTVSFSEALAGTVGNNNFSATNGTVTSVTQVGSSNAYTVAVTPTANLASGNVALSLVGTGLTDIAGNALASSADTRSLASQAIDTLAPSLQSNQAPSTSLTTLAGGPGNSAGETITLTLTFDGNVNGLTSGSNSTVFTVAGTGVSATWGGTAGTSTRTLTYTIQAGDNGQAAIDEVPLKSALLAGITDAAGNAFTYSGSIANIDSTPLPNFETVTLTSAATASLDAQLQGLARLSNNTGSGGARALQTQMLDAWRAFQGNVGAVVASHESARASSAAVESRLESDFQSRSGVNLDEEAANLLRYQQTYAAASRLIQTNAALLDGLLAIVGR